MFKKFKNHDELHFLKITTISLNSKVVLILHNLTAYKDDPILKIIVMKENNNAIATFIFNNEKGKHEFEKIEMGNWQEE